ncbi:MAG: SDR family oxidoreductase [Phycisphaerae bacterium]|jgi:nucleoside-diphosphate-sugar epimerase
MKILIIGCGYVGSALGQTLIQLGHEVVGTTTTPSRLDELENLGITPMQLDLTDADRLRDALREQDTVYLTIAPRQRGMNYRDVYLAAARRLVDAIRETSVRRIIYTGSTRVYGQTDGTWVDETSPTNPSDENGEVLLQTEQTLLRGVEPPTTAAVLRLGGIYGPDRDFKQRIRTLAGTARTDADLYVNLVHLDDIVAALIALLTVPYHGVLNLVDDSPERRQDLYDRTLAEASLPPVRWERPPADDATRLGKRVRNDLVKRTLNLTLKHPAH